MKIGPTANHHQRPQWTSQHQSVFEAWWTQVESAPTPELAHELHAREGELFPKFIVQYDRLRALPRRVRRAMQRKVAVSLAGAALLLALGHDPGFAATINVDGTTCTIVDAIAAANTDTATGGGSAGSGADTISLVSGSTHTLTAVNNTSNGENGLPVVTSEMTIAGNEATIERASSAPAFRILNVAIGADLTLQETTIGAVEYGATVPIPIAAMVEGFTPAKIICRNLDTRQTVIITDGSPSVDCEAAGLTIADGERVDIIVKGTK